MRTHTLLCTIHKLKYEVPSEDLDAAAKMACPSCMRKAIEILNRQTDEIREHRDILLKAIEIKTQIVVSEPL